MAMASSALAALREVDSLSLAAAAVRAAQEQGAQVDLHVLRTLLA